MAKKTQKVNIDGKEYDMDKLPKEVLNMLGALSECDKAINDHKTKITLLTTARATYSANIKKQLEEKK